MVLTKNYNFKKVNICDVKYGECFLYNDEVHMKVNQETYQRILDENNCYENIVVNLENNRLNGLNSNIDVVMLEATVNVRMCRE